MRISILILDDELELLTVCKIILEEHNYKVETRLVCDNIIKDIGEVNPAIILMDLWISTIGGEAAIKLIKNTSDTQHIPVILFSANNDINIIANRANANGFLVKPFEIDPFLNIIKNTLSVLPGMTKIEIILKFLGKREATFPNMSIVGYSCGDVPGTQLKKTWHTVRYTTIGYS